jgi:hypothetical protein
MEWEEVRCLTFVRSCLEILHIFIFSIKRDPSLMIKVKNMSSLAMMHVPKVTSFIIQPQERLLLVEMLNFKKKAHVKEIPKRKNIMIFFPIFEEEEEELIREVLQEQTTPPPSPTSSRDDPSSLEANSSKRILLCK